MAKNILFFADGTWNAPDQDDNHDGQPDPTNVVKLFGLLRGSDDVASMVLQHEQERVLIRDGQVLQVAKYLHGVGDSRNWLVRVLGGVFGAGVVARIARGYTFVSRHFEPGDRITLVGFSRGAYTVRALGGMIAAQGLLDRAKVDLDDREESYRLACAAWDHYREPRLERRQRGLFDSILRDMPAFVRGAIEVQDEGSQLLALLVDAKRGEMVVDFCAGAGGKTLALGAMMRNTGRLYAFDVSGHRLEALKPRLARSGLSNVYPAQIAHERDERIKRLAGKIDRVLVDAPCSGLGTLRRNPDLKWRQSPAAIEELRVKQGAILASAARLLKPGGRLVYATCSLLATENEAVAAAFTAEQPAFAPLPAAQVLQQAGVEGADTLCSGDALRLWPHRHATDGFFAAVWERR